MAPGSLSLHSQRMREHSFGRSDQKNCWGRARLAPFGCVPTPELITVAREMAWSASLSHIPLGVGWGLNEDQCHLNHMELRRVVSPKERMPGGARWANDLGLGQKDERGCYIIIGQWR